MEWLLAIIKYLFIAILLSVYPIGLETNKVRYKVTPVIVYAIIGINVLIYLIMILGDWLNYRGFYNDVINAFGFLPAAFLTSNTENGAGDAFAIGMAFLSLVTHQFLHGGFLHLLGNMMALNLFGPQVEAGQNIKFRGQAKTPYNTFFPFIIFYLLCGLGAVLTHFTVACFSGSESAVNTVLVGASGAISGIIGAYLVGLWSDYNRARISVLFIFNFTINVSWYILYWAGLQFAMLLIYGAGGTVSFSAHVGGFFTGIIVWYFVTPWVNNMTKANIRGWFRSKRKGGSR
ncbi:MAG: rhomboid family intramembrane serine protease [Chlorobiaceae bacterium]